MTTAPAASPTVAIIASMEIDDLYMPDLPPLPDGVTIDSADWDYGDSGMAESKVYFVIDDVRVKGVQYLSAYGDSESFWENSDTLSPMSASDVPDEAAEWLHAYHERVRPLVERAEYSATAPISGWIAAHAAGTTATTPNLEDRIAAFVAKNSFGAGTYEDSADEVGDAEGQPIIETFPDLRKLVADAIREFVQG